MIEKVLFCAQCTYMEYYDWYNCVYPEIDVDNLPDGLYIDEYWNLIRIEDKNMYNKCPFYKQRGEDE